MSIYAQNLEKTRTLITRNQTNIEEVNQPSFWISDVKNENNQMKVKIAFQSTINWLKIVQEQGESCSFYPIDGNNGVFRNNGLVVQSPNRFTYEWATENGVEIKNAGDCDCLLLNEKWHFIEFKTDASSTDIKQMTNNRNKGETQLAKTMTAFKESLQDNTLPCVCVLVVPKVYPKVQASLILRGVKFQKRFDKKVQLIEVSNDGNNSYGLK